MIEIRPIPFIGRRRDRAKAPPGLTLVGATYELKTAVTLAFNMSIDISAIDVSQVFVIDGIDSTQWQGSGPAVLLDPQTVRITLVIVGKYVGTDVVLLQASASTGIAPSSGGAAWAGASDLVLPFG